MARRFDGSEVARHGASTPTCGDNQVASDGFAVNNYMRSADVTDFVAQRLTFGKQFNQPID